MSDLVVSSAIQHRIRELGVLSYPHECCGLLVGFEKETRRVVTGIRPVENQRTDSLHNRFAIDSRILLMAERELEQDGILGFYHSHPDALPQPSDYDLQWAWPWYSYLIVSVVAGQASQMKSWRLLDDRSRFEVETLLNETL
jgi:proteasome lid subunit RPN8/RPN11